MVTPESEYNQGLAKGNRNRNSGSLSNYKPKQSATKMPKTFAELSKTTQANKEAVLFKIFVDLYNGHMAQQQEGFKRMWDIYSGKDEEFKKNLERFFGEQGVLYSGMDLNSIINSMANKLIQPFLSKDDILAVTPNTIDVETADRISELLNTQMIQEDVVQELAKVVKDGYIYGIGFMSIGWETTFKILKKRVLRQKETDSMFEPYEVSIAEVDASEEVILEEPDFKAESVGHIYYPDARRWKDLPYVIRKEVISRSILNERYGTEFDELDRSVSHKAYETDFDRMPLYIPGTESIRGNNVSDLVDILHFYFRDGSYYVCQLSTVEGAKGDSLTNGLKILYEGESPIPGLPIPIIPFIPNPITNRIQGESAISLAMGDQRKITELDNLVMRTIRSQANCPIAYTDGSGLNINEYMSRTPGMPIKVQDLEQIKELPVERFDASMINLKEHYIQKLQSLTGQSDFSMGNIGRSARLTGVDSLVGLAMSRMTFAMSQFNLTILDLADALILVNRAFLPLDYGRYQTSLYSQVGEQLLEIPYPLNVKIRSNLSGTADKSITLGALREAIQLGFQLNMMQPGSVDINSLAQRFFAEAGLRDIGRYFLKSPMSLKEKQTMHMIDSMIASQLSPGGMPLQPQDPNQMQQQGMDVSGQGQMGSMPTLEESTNTSF